jgi:hypothetical protein
MPVFTDADAMQPGFDLGLELLCCLPPSPAKITLSKLVRDLSLASQAHAHELIGQLRRRGFRIFVSNSDDAGRLVCIDCSAWAEASRAAEGYWQATHGEPAALAPGDAGDAGDNGGEVGGEGGSEVEVNGEEGGGRWGGIT